MHFFRRHPDMSQALPREATPADITAVSRLLRDGSRRFLGASAADLPGLLAGAPTMALATDREILGFAIGGWPVEDTIWLRALALEEGVSVQAGLDGLLPPFYALLRSRGLGRLFYAGDAASDAWLIPALQARGFAHDTRVVVYEKQGLSIPSRGNLAARVRRAQLVDLPDVLALDRACFAAQWVKDEGVIGPALMDMPFFVVAELRGATVGYAFATSHFSGRLLHLVRIAVQPALRGQAVGVRLLAELVAYARSSGADMLTLNTQQENHTAQRLYEWFGFRRTGEHQSVLRRDLQ